MPLTGAELAKLIMRHGWVHQRSKGSHAIYKKEGCPALITIPMHGNKQLTPGLLHKMLKTAGLKESDR